MLAVDKNSGSYIQFRNLLKGLEEQGKLDKTVIVLYSDHYPYGLDNTTLNSYFDYNVNIAFFSLQS